MAAKEGKRTYAFGCRTGVLASRTHQGGRSSEPSGTIRRYAATRNLTRWRVRTVVLLHGVDLALARAWRSSIEAPTK
jgi:hypothetical protein